MNYFKSVEETFSNQTFNTKISTDNQRFKAHYNSLKSCLLLESVSEKARIIDLGCGKGTELLKYQMHNPSAVVLVDISCECLMKAQEFAKDKNISYDIFDIQLNIATDELFNHRLTLPKEKIGRTISTRDFDVATSFSVLEFLPSIEHLHHTATQVYKTLARGGFWIGCLIDTNILFERLDTNNEYKDTYCSIQRKHGEYFMTVNDKTTCQNLCISPDVLEQTAAQVGFQIVKSTNWATYMGGISFTPEVQKLTRVMQLNDRNKLKVSDLRALSLMHVFKFQKP
jgi:SAM-dependent methyltransferase